MTCRPQFSLVAPACPADPGRAPRGDGAWIVDPETGYVDEVKRRAAFEARRPDVQFGRAVPDWTASLMVAGARRDVRPAWDLGVILDRLDALAAEDEQAAVNGAQRLRDAFPSWTFRAFHKPGHGWRVEAVPNEDNGSLSGAVGTAGEIEAAIRAAA